MYDELDKTSPVHSPMTVALSQPCLKLLAGELSGQVLPISLSEFVVGRSPNCDLVLPVPGVNREHIKLLRALDGTVRLVDVSTQGTYVNGHRVTHQQLQEYDVIGLEETPLAEFVHHRPHEINQANRLAQHSSRDPLTGVFNRHHFMESLEKEVRKGAPFSVLIVAPDPSPAVRTSWQETGPPQDLLKSLAERLETGLGNDFVLARVERELFGVLLREQSFAQARQLAEELRLLAAGEPFQPGPVPLTVSVGVAEWSRSSSLQELLQAARGAQATARTAGNSVSP